MTRVEDFRYRQTRKELVETLHREDELFEQATGDPEAAQEELLRSIVGWAADSDFGRSHGFDRIASPADYQHSVPLHQYSDLAPWMDRIADGEADVLFPGRPLYVAQTSGTTGTPKIIPAPAAVGDEYAAAVGPFLVRMERAFPGAWHRGALLTGRCMEGVLPSGVLLCSASGAFRNQFDAHPFYRYAPEEVFEETRAEARYLQLAYYLMQREDLACLATLNPSTLLTLFEQLAVHRDEIADSLESGRPPRSRLAAETPRPDLARRFRQAELCYGRIRPTDLWPRLEYFTLWRSGGAAHYLPLMRELAPGVKFWSFLTSSTESTLLVPMTEAWGGGAPALRSTYFECFPAEEESSSSIPLSELEVGGSYRFAVTNRRGLYRYLMEDAFLVEAYYKKTPILQFSHRIGQTSSLTGEKLTQSQVCEAVGAIDAGSRLGEFQVGPHWADPPCYVLAIELREPQSVATLRTWLERFERKLCEQNLEYSAKRSSLRLADPELWVLRPGFFIDQRRRFTEGQGRSDAQYKHRHLLREMVVADEVNPEQRVSLRA